MYAPRYAHLDSELHVTRSVNKSTILPFIHRPIEHLKQLHFFPQIHLTKAIFYVRVNE